MWSWRTSYSERIAELVDTVKQLRKDMADDKAALTAQLACVHAAEARLDQVMKAGVN